MEELVSGGYVQEVVERFTAAREVAVGDRYLVFCPSACLTVLSFFSRGERSYALSDVKSF